MCSHPLRVVSKFEGVGVVVVDVGRWLFAVGCCLVEGGPAPVGSGDVPRSELVHEGVVLRTAWLTSPSQLRHLLLLLLLLSLHVLQRRGLEEPKSRGVDTIVAAASQQRHGQRRHHRRRRLQSQWGGVLLVLRLPPRPRVLRDSWPHSGPRRLLSPWG